MATILAVDQFWRHGIAHFSWRMVIRNHHWASQYWGCASVGKRPFHPPRLLCHGCQWVGKSVALGIAPCRRKDTGLAIRSEVAVHAFAAVLLFVGLYFLMPPYAMFFQDWDTEFSWYVNFVIRQSRDVQVYPSVTISILTLFILLDCAVFKKLLKDLRNYLVPF